MAPKHPLEQGGLPTGGPTKKAKLGNDEDVDMPDAEDELPRTPGAGLFDPFVDPEALDPTPGLDGYEEFSTDPTTSTDPPFPTDPVDVPDEPDPAMTLEDLDYTDHNLQFDIPYVEHSKDESADQNSPIPGSSPPTVSGAAGVISKIKSTVSWMSKSGQIQLYDLKIYIPFYKESEPDKDVLLKKFKRVDNLDKEIHGNAGQGWIGVNEALGEGGQGCARLFVKLDKEGKIVDRIAVKETYESAATWLSTDFWHEHREGKDPREAIIHRLLSLETEQKWERYIIGYRGHSINHKNKSHRTYMEYVDGGDLHKLFKAQNRKYTHINKHDADGSPSRDTDGAEGVPEAFVWYSLRQMATAMHRMNNTPLRVYKEYHVVHQDIKPANIFLGRCDPNEFPLYPIMKLGDFGSARITSKYDSKNPGRFRGDARTPGYIAPEMSSAMQRRNPWSRLGSATNVWQIATTAVQMMRSTLPEVIEYNENKDPGHPTLGDLRSGNEYSNELVNLLAEMLHPDPDSRADCQDIMNAYVENKEVWLEMADPNVARNFETSNLWLHWREGDGKWGVGTVFENPERSEDFRAREAKRLKKIVDDVKKRVEDKKKKKDEEDKEGGGDDGDDGGSGDGGDGDGDHGGPESTVKGLKKPPPAKKQPRKPQAVESPDEDDDAPDPTVKKPKPRNPNVKKAPRKPPPAGTDDGTDDGTAKKPMTPSEAGKVAGKHLPKKGTALPQYGQGAGKGIPQKAPPPGTGKGPPPGTGKGPPPGTGKGPPPGTGKGPPPETGKQPPSGAENYIPGQTIPRSSDSSDVDMDEDMDED